MKLEAGQIWVDPKRWCQRLILRLTDGGERVLWHDMRLDNLNYESCSVENFKRKVKGATCTNMNLEQLQEKLAAIYQNDMSGFLAIERLVGTLRKLRRCIAEKKYEEALSRIDLELDKYERFADEMEVER